jgi:hypothetical protein
MRIFLSLTILLFSLNSGAFYYEEPDKNLHVGVSLGLSLVGTQLVYRNTKASWFEAYLISATTVLALGLAKEMILDDVVDVKDLQANLGGVGLAIPLLILTF